MYSIQKKVTSIVIPSLQRSKQFPQMHRKESLGILQSSSTTFARPFGSTTHSLPARNDSSILESSSQIMEQNSNSLSIRLYRMLLRQCQSLVKDSTINEKLDSKHIMLQPNVIKEQHDGIYLKTAPPVVTKSLDLFRLFYVMHEHDEMQKKGNDEKESLSNHSKHQHYNERRHYSSVVNQNTGKQSDMSIDDWFFEVTGGLIPLFHNEDDVVLRKLLKQSCWTNQDQLKKAIRMAFQTKYHRVKSQDLHKWTIRALQLLQEQQELWNHTSVSSTNDPIRVVATSRCMCPKIGEKHHSVSYKIRIENLSQYSMQLLSRCFEFQELGEDNKPIDREPIVENKVLAGSGSNLTTLRPGQCFEFVSNVDLELGLWQLQGSFSMNRILTPTTPNVVGMDVIPIGNEIQVDLAPLRLTAN